MNYEAMSDFEINKAVYEALELSPSDSDLLFERIFNEFKSIPELKLAFHGASDSYYTKDYCNNWADMGPIIVENDIGIEPNHIASRKIWVAFNGQIAADSGNPLRAAAIVYLKMQECK
ncbi:NinX [Vibrio phage 1.210.O._10N.222.52.C2]|nr:NinX [Vibrio phage 1.210.O._10N.222.52.C2]